MAARIATMDDVLFRLGEMLTDVGGAAGALFSPTTERAVIMEWIAVANRWQHYQLFEMAAAVYSETLPLDMLLLTDGPERVFARVRAVRPPTDLLAEQVDHFWNVYLDRGYDSATSDYARTVQAKWYAPRRAITFTAAATFSAASSIVQAGRKDGERWLIHSEGSRVPPAVAAVPGLRFVEMSDVALADIFMRALQTFGARREQLGVARIDAEMEEVVAQNDDTASVADDDSETECADSESESGETASTDSVSEHGSEDGVGNGTEDDVEDGAEADSVVERHGVPFELRAVQLQMLEAIRRQHFRGRLRFETPPGSGKTTFLAWLAATQLAGNPEFRCVFFVPTKQIAHDVAATFTDFGLPCALLHSSYKCPQLDRACVVVCCYGSALRLAGQQFTHMYVDEAHHLENVETRAAPAIRPYLHAIADMQAELRIEISATFRTRELDLCVGHDAAVAEKIVLPLRYIVPRYDGDDRMSAVANYLVANTHIHRRVLAYCNTEREAMRFADVAAQAGLLADTIFGSTPMRRRAELLERFVDGRARVLVSVETLCEGVDIRAADTCVFVEARSSRINVWQCIGRVMRVHEGKQWGWVILPTMAEGVELRRFADIVRVHDPSAFENGRPGKRIEQVCAEWRGDEEFSSSCEYESLEAALMGEWWQKLTWLRECVAAEGGLPSTTTVWTRPDGSEWKIGNWINTQRQARKKGKLSEDQVRLLKAVPGWIWEDETKKNAAAKQPWPVWLEVLRECVAVEDGLPKQSTVWMRPDGSSWKVGTWIGCQRCARKKGKLSEDRVRQLETIPGWVWKDETKKNMATKQPWQAWLEALRECVAAEKGLPKRTTVWTRPDGSEWKIGNWIAGQRRTRKKGKLSEDRVRQLETIPGWFWEDRIVTAVRSWPAWLEALRECVAAGEGPKKSTVWVRPDGSEWKIGNWIDNQRQARKKGKLSEDQVRLLEAVPGWNWEDERMKNAAAKQPWPVWLEVLRECVAVEEGLPKRTAVWTRPDGSKWKIGLWISEQRQARKKGKLPEDRARQLEAVPGWKW
jgi:superfamily II DNA or RNA helicase